MKKLSNSAQMLNIEEFLQQKIADKIKTCPSRIKILSISCIDRQWSQPVDELGIAIDDYDYDDEELVCELRAVRNVKWRLSYCNGDDMFNGKVYTAELESHWTGNIKDSEDYVYVFLDEDDAKNLIAELTELSEVNLRDAKKYLL